MTNSRKRWLVGSAAIISLSISIVLFRSSRQPSRTTLNYKKLICEDAFDDAVQEDGLHFRVKLHEGCFGKLVYLPRGWNGWHYQPVGNDQNWWVAFWVQGDQNPRGPYDRYATPSFTYLPMRFQGKEGAEITIFTTGR